MSRFTTVLAVVAIAVAFWYIFNWLQPPKPPQLDPNAWWGPIELKGREDISIRPFEIKFEKKVIDDLKYRLKNHRPFAPPLEGVTFEYGFNTAALEPWLKYWAEEYKFADREKFFNQFPHFKTSIKGLDIHFIRVKPQVSAGVQTLPLLLLHGWPGSVREFYEAIPLLTSQNSGYDFAFEVIVPSLPGYGFSDAAVRPGLSLPYVADIFRILMKRLGHDKFYIQGGDWGAAIASAMVTLFPEDVLGHHSNSAVTQHPHALLRTLLGALIPSLIVEDHLAERMYPLSKHLAYLLEEFGYFHLQATKPDTVGVSLTDSPSGLLAYILEKFAVWTRKEHKFKSDGGLGFRFSKEKLIDNLMVYWITNSITSSMRFYSENMSNKFREMNLEAFTSPVPTWALQARDELVYQPPAVLRAKYPNLLNVTVLDDGGHFLALELPEVFAEDVFKAVHAFKKWRSTHSKTDH